MVRQGFESHSVEVWKELAAHPLFLFWGHIPQAPWEGALPPPPPQFSPPSFAESLPRFWVPLGGKLTGVGYQPLILVLRGDTPNAPLYPSFFLPSFAEGLPRF